jgi:diguanylate cyclase (GGDEF)-like protein
VTTTVQEPQPVGLFEQAGRHVLRYLAEHAPLAFWAVTRVENGRQTYLAVHDEAYGLRAGQWHDWADSFCIHMSSGAAPRIAPDAVLVPEYATAGVRQAIDINAYAGAAISDGSGRLFGAICGLDPQAQGEELRLLEPLLVTLSELLTIALVADRERHVAHLRHLEVQLAAERDALTGLYTRGAWDRLLDEAQATFQQLVDPTALVVVDLDGLKELNDREGHAAGDALLARAGAALSSAVRADDPVARLGGDEFAVLLRQTTADRLPDRVDRLRRALEAADVAASVGAAAARPGEQLTDVLAAADQAMYADKQSRRGDGRRG